ncbi:MAG: 3-hydroxyacyl-CoA dehydrogenase NAD-binding domain-containing protein [Planctomycetota bacterium]|nr:3-hydroxyacyl-CoA dehydrogenase NAD-binding domain-containing protein [Planctomycetota bacterium]
MISLKVPHHGNPWTLDIDSAWIAWLTFDLKGEKVNVFNEHALAELEMMLDQLHADERIKALVLTSGKRDSFIAGADIEELAKIKDDEDARAKSQAGQTVFEKIATMPVPTVAAIHGACMGGGLEMALACDYRLVTDHPKTILALPEVNLGILPGWGGTQRLPQLIGLAMALPMILGGKNIPGKKAYRMGLADGIIAEAFVRQQGADFVERVLTRSGRAKVMKRRAKSQSRVMKMLQANPLGRAIIYRQSLKQVLKKTNGNYPAPLKALKVVQKTFRRRPIDQGLVLEATYFSKLACTPISRNLVNLFQASQRAKKAGAPDVKLELRSGGVLGAGLMGAGIASAMSRAGMAVRLKDISWEALGKGLSTIAKGYKGRVKRRRMTQGEMDQAMLRVAPTIDFTGFANLDIVVEAVIENMDLKVKVLRELEDSVGPDTIICTNTSSLPLNDLAAIMKRPKRFIGLHFFNPVDRMPLVEIVPCKKTSKETILAAVQLVKDMGKIPVVVGDCPGFLVNRILIPYLVESAWMFEEGIDIERLDSLLEQFGMPMGPMALVDEVGIDVGYKAAKTLESAYGDRMNVPSALDEVAESGDLLGKKNGKGFYIYEKKSKKPNERVYRLIEEARRRDGISPRDIPDGDVIDRAILIMVNEAARCLEEHVVDDPEALDIAMVMGTGFAPFRGGLLRYADERGVREIMHRLEEFEQKYGERFKPARLIEKVAKSGGRFYSNN